MYVDVETNMIHYCLFPVHSWLCQAISGYCFNPITSFWFLNQGYTIYIFEMLMLRAVHAIWLSVHAIWLSVHGFGCLYTRSGCLYTRSDCLYTRSDCLYWLLHFLVLSLLVQIVIITINVIIVIIIIDIVIIPPAGGQAAAVWSDYAPRAWLQGESGVWSYHLFCL